MVVEPVSIVRQTGCCQVLQLWPTLFPICVQARSEGSVCVSVWASEASHWLDSLLPNIQTLACQYKSLEIPKVSSCTDQTLLPGHSYR